MSTTSGTQENSEGQETPPTTGEKEEEDPNLRILNARRMLELRKRKMAQSPTDDQGTVNRKQAEKRSPPPSDREILLRALRDRGDEVLAAAEANYPREMARLVPAIARLLREGRFSTISGGELLHFLRSIGLRVSVPTSITVQEHGKFVSLADKLRKADG